MRAFERRAGLAILVAIAFTATDTIVVAPRAATDELPLISAAELPALPSVGNLNQPAGEPGDFSNPPPTESEAGNRPAPKDPPSFNPLLSTLISAETTPTQLVYQNPDGTRTSVFTTLPTRYQNPDGTWSDIDLTLQAIPGGPLTAVAAPETSVKLAPQTGGTDATVPTALGDIDVHHPGAAQTASFIAGRVATYPDALGDGIDLRQMLTVSGFEEAVVLDGPEDPASYLVEFSLPPGMTARQGAGGVEFVTATDEMIGVFGQGIASDAAPIAAGNGAETNVLTTLVSFAANLATVSVGIDPSWLADPDRDFPVVIDPYFYYANTSNAGFDTYVQTDLGPQSSSLELRLGTPDGGDTFAMPLIRFNLPTAHSDKHVSEAHMSVYNYYSASCTAREVQVYGLAEGFDAGTHWYNQPSSMNDPDIADDYVSRKFFAHGSAGCPGAWEDLDVTELAWNWFRGALPNYGLQLYADEYDSVAYKKFYSGETGGNSAPALSVTWTNVPNQSVPESPANDSVFMTTTPTLTVQPGFDQDGDPVKYWFKVATGSTGETGSIVNSGWIDSRTWTPPAGTLFDGIYYWRVWTYDGIIWRDPSWVRKITLNPRLGDDGPQPMDGLGPAKVNLASGNLVVKAASPSMATVGGGIGLSYAYNSAEAKTGGLTGSYYPDNNVNRIFDDALMMARTDPMVYFDWGTGTPVAAIGTDNFLVRWSGYVVAPVTGTYYLGAISDDGIKMWGNGYPLLVRWFVQSPSATPYWGSPIPLVANTPFPIDVEFYEATVNAVMKLYIKGPGIEAPVPSSWLSPTDRVVPPGWTMSADGDGALMYIKARVSEGSVMLTSPSGATTTYKSNPSGGFTPPEPDDGVMAKDTQTGLITVHGPDGITYRFNADGTLASATSPLDDKNPAAPEYTWSSGVPPRLTEIEDPVSGRGVDLYWGGDAACPQTVPPGVDLAAPGRMLCKVSYWNATSTKLFYVGGRLGRIEDPGGEVTDFGYSNELMTKIRDPVLADAVAATLVPDDDTSRTLVGYDTTDRVNVLTAPAPAAGELRPEHTYGYGSGETSVSVAGLAQPNGFARRVKYDAGGRPTEEIDAAGATTKTTWNSADRPTSSTDPTGIKSTTIFDVQKRPTDAYGPASESCFNASGTPNGSCPAMPRNRTFYDEGIQGLGATYYSTRHLTGAPLCHERGVGPGGAIWKDWGLGSAPCMGAENETWSARYTGEILLTATGNYNFRTYADDGTRLFIDDTLVVNDWNVHPPQWSADSPYYNVTANTYHKIRLEYFDETAGARLELHWSLPGGGGQATGDYLFPRYDLVTSKIDADARLTTTEFAAPERGLATANVVDPAGLNLRSTTTYEASGSGYSRRTARTLPKGGSTSVAYTYYGDTAIADDPCTSGTQSINQAGLPRKSTAADPDGGGPKTPIVRESVYDVAGRPIANRVVGDSQWACTTYDSRGRVISQKDRTGATTTLDYSAPATLTTTFPDSAGTSRTTVGKSDWAGRAISYTDEHATVSRSTYDQASRPTATYRKFFGGTETQVTSMTYDTAGRLASLTEHLATSPRTTTFTYDTAGRALTTTRPNGVVTTNTNDPSRGWLNAISHTKDSSELSPWTYTRSLTGDIASEATTGVTRNFTYDAAGRLTRTIEGAATRRYSYDANSNRCSNGPTCDGSYSYDNADRITASPYASSYVYDSHGNITSTIGGTTEVETERSATVSVGAPSDFYLGATAAGSITAEADWAESTASANFNGSITGVGVSDHPVVVSANGDINASLSWTTGLVANLDLLLLDPSGTPVASSTSPTGNTEQISYQVAGLGSYPATANYTLRVVGVAAALATPYELTETHPVTANLNLKLYAPGGALVSSATSSSAKPETLSYAVSSGTTGTYRLEVSSAQHTGAFDLDLSFLKVIRADISYDANDHATVIEDGTTRIEETLSPSGRVVRRKIIDHVTGAVSEDVTLGYSDPGDSPSYTRPTSGGTVTTYLGHVIVEGQVASYPIANAHGDVAGKTDEAGVFVANPATDEFGVGGAPSDRLGWLGTHQRFSLGGDFGFIRMGVRLYDPELGRFLEVDPIEGGSANDYDYVNQDPLNGYDLGGTKATNSYRKFCARRRFARKCVTALEISARAFALTGLLYGDPRINSGPGNGFRHVLWATMLTVALGAKFARSFMAVHEKPNEDPVDLAADAANNALGIRLGRRLRHDGFELEFRTWRLAVSAAHWLAQHRALE